MRGGMRPGAGRKRGQPNKANQLRRELSDRAAAEGITPLEVMLTAMRQAWGAGQNDKACQIAKDAAPYVHPRLSAVDADLGLPDYESALLRLANQSG